jgi:hypothetical protein
MKNNLQQVIVNTKGFARIVSQDRDSLGRFTGPAQVGSLMNPVQVVRLSVKSDSPLVLVQHSYNGTQQTVSSVNRETREGNVVTFVNDGKTGGMRESLYGKL